MSQVKAKNNKDKRPARLEGKANVFGNRLQELRKEHGYSFEDIGNILKKSKQAIIGYRHGYRFPQMRDIDKLANLFNTSVAYLIGETDIPGPPVTFKTLAELIKNGDFHEDGRVLSEEELQERVKFLEAELERINKNKENAANADKEQHAEKA